MGGLLYPFDFEHRSMAKKVFNQKRRNGGLETPRNSLELQIESFQNCCAADEIPYSYQIGEVFPDKDCYQNEASMKKLIDKEMMRHTNTRHNGPNIVARLMGMDMFPLDAKDEIQLSDKRHDSKGGKIFNKERNGRSLQSHASSKLISSREMDLHLSYHDNNDRDADRWNSIQKLGKPCRREHPQEEELQKFKKEFEAWQAARFRECSRVIEFSNIDRQSLSREEIIKEKMSLYANSKKISNQKPSELKGSTVEMKSFKSIGLDNGNGMDISAVKQRGRFSLRSKSMDADFEHPCQISSSQKIEKSCGPKIVILKPGPDSMCHHEEKWTSSSRTSGERASIEDLLEEVKERLRCELQGKTFQKGSVARGSGIETPYSEKPSPRRQVARNSATQIRGSVTRDIGINFLHSESTRSYKNETESNGLGSTEFINKNTSLFSERLRNIRRKDSDLDSGSSRSSLYENERSGKQVETATTMRKHTNYWEIFRDAEEIQARSFRHEVDENEVLPGDLSPRNLIRSLSAPVSGTSFGKLLLEDRHVLTGVHIQRKHEASDNVVVDVKKQRKERFSFKEKVSNFRYFTLRRKLFGRRTHSIIGSHATDLYTMKDILSGPTVVMNSGERHERENFTEVPPSPASVCSSVQEDFWRLSDHHSPISTSDVTPRDENCVSQVFREISSNLKELRKQLNQLESDDFEDKVEQRPVESEISKLEDPSEAYIRDLLIASGMYDGSPDKIFSRKNTAAKPISDTIFEEVEEAYRKSEKTNETSEKEPNENDSVDHKLLFDLLNEALPTVVAPCLTMSRFRRKVINPSMVPPLFGKKLLDSVWGIVRKFIHSPTDRSYYLLDGVIARDLNSTPFSTLMDDEVNTTGREVESLIIRDLVEEIVKDLQSFNT